MSALHVNVMPNSILLAYSPFTRVASSNGVTSFDAITPLGPYPPMPKYQPEMGTKLVIFEEEMMVDEKDEDPTEGWDLDDPEQVKVNFPFASLACV